MRNLTPQKAAKMRVVPMEGLGRALRTFHALTAFGARRRKKGFRYGAEQGSLEGGTRKEKEFILLLDGWVVEGTFAWLGRYWRLSKN
jgi:hypothetical protein